MSTGYIRREALVNLKSKKHLDMASALADVIGKIAPEINPKQLQEFENSALHLVLHDRKPFMLNWIYLFERNKHNVSEDFYDETLDCAVDLVENDCDYCAVDFTNMLWAVAKMHLRSNSRELRGFKHVKQVVDFVIDKLSTLIQYHRISLAYVVAALKIQLTKKQIHTILDSIDDEGIRDKSELFSMLDFYIHTGVIPNNKIIGPIVDAIRNSHIWSLERIESSLSLLDSERYSILINMCIEKRNRLTKQ